MNNDIAQIITEGGGYYYFKTTEPMDNIQSMQYFLDYILEEVEIDYDDGTYVEVFYYGDRLGLHSGGNGDFNHHKITIEVI